MGTPLTPPGQLLHPQNYRQYPKNDRKAPSFTQNDLQLNWKPNRLGSRLGETSRKN